jgi:group I intron endonuclease
MFYIYEIRNKVTDFTYIGYTNNLNWRWKLHHRQLIQQKHHNVHLQRAWNKYGEQAFEWTVLKEYVDKQSALLEEINLITREKNTYNTAKGGSGGNIVGNLPEQQYKEFLRNCSEGQKRRYSRPGEREKTNCFANLTEEKRQDRLQVWSAAKIGSKNSRYKYDKPVLQIDQKTGEVVREWLDVSEAGRSGYERRYVLACCKGRKGYNSHKGYIWKWKE